MPKPQRKPIVKTRIYTYPNDPEETLSLALTYLRDGATYTATLYASVAATQLVEKIGGLNGR